MIPGQPARGRLARLLWATRYALAGLGHALRAERAFQEEVLCLVVLVIPGAFLFGNGAVERSLLIGSWVFVLVVELLNTAIERAVDRIGPERHEVSGQAKDLGAAAVATAILLALVVWALVLLGG
jgi:diacylglycerol kinase (ATP)